MTEKAKKLSKRERTRPNGGPKAVKREIKKVGKKRRMKW